MSALVRIFQTTAAREAFRFDSNAVGRIVSDLEDGIRYLVCAEGLGATAGVLFPLDPSAMGGGGAFDPASYYGYSNSAVTWGSATWTAALAVPAAWTDTDQTGISRSGSDFTFTEAGKYCIVGTANYAHLTGTKFFQMRFRDTGAGSTIISFATAANGGNLGSLVLCGNLDATAGQVLQLQYVTTDALNTAAWGPQTNDGEITRTMYLGIHRIA